MKNLKSLSKKLILILFIFSSIFNVFADDKPSDIWNITDQQMQENIDTKEISEDDTKQTNEILENSIYKMQSKEIKNQIDFDQNLSSGEIKIFGLYDPEENGLDINMWSNSDGDQLKNIFAKLKKIQFSEDAREIMNISLLTNAYYPKKNISTEEFLELKSDWLIKNSDLDLIKTYLVKNQILDTQPKLTKFLIDEYLSNFQIKKACEIFSKNLKPINDDYLLKMNIYCLIKDGKNEEAQLIYDLKKEMGFKNEYFENKINYLFNYTNQTDKTISENTIFDFHLAHQTDPNFSFEPSENTKKIIWKYLSSANLLSSFKEVEVSELDRILLIEKAVNNKNYPEKELFQIYKRFQFNINQLLNVEEFFKSLPNIEGRALIYQKILLESEPVEKLKLLKILKESFKKDNLDDAFDIELKKFLEDFNPIEIPDNLTSFYYTNIEIKDDKKKKIKFNNEILHQSKLINYFNGDYTKNKIEKDINNFLRKVKKNKKYNLTVKDQIFIDSLRSDGVEIDKKFTDLIDTDVSTIPTDIQVMINNDEKGAVLLRLAEVIGQDKLERIDDDTMYFIISSLNQLNINILRNKILLKVLPLKV